MICIKLVGVKHIHVQPALFITFDYPIFGSFTLAAVDKVNTC